MRYKVGDKVVIKKDTKFDKIDYSNQVATINRIRTWKTLPYDYEVDLNCNWCVYDETIDHEATAKLNEPTPKSLLKSGDKVTYRDGTERWVLLETETLHDDKGNPLNSLNRFKDDLAELAFNSNDIMKIERGPIS